MLYPFSALLARMKYITRWSLMHSTRAESLSEHTCDTALLAHLLCLIAKHYTGTPCRPEVVAVAALYHDAPEIITGDMPTPVKYHSPALRDAYKALETESVRSMAPCQPINCRRDTFAETVAMAREKGVRMHTHLGEGENEGMIARWGKRTMDWCEEMDFIGEDVWYAHDWEVTKEEYKVLAATGTGVSHCPAPAVLGGFPILNIKEMQEAGILVSLGCDGSATNDSSNLLDALRMAYLMQAYHTKERGGCTSAYDMLKVATVNGAKTLGRTDLGTLEAGKAADLFMIDTETLELAGALHDPKNLLARVGLTGPVWMTMINGNIVYKDGILKGVDERKLAMDGEAVCTRVIREPHSAYRDFI